MVVPSQNLGGGLADEVLGGRVDQQVAPIRVLYVDGIGCAVDNRAQQCAALLDLLLGLQTLADVALNRQDRRLPAERDASGRGFHRDLAAVLSESRARVELDAAGLNGLSPIFKQ